MGRPAVLRKNSLRTHDRTDGSSADLILSYTCYHLLSFPEMPAPWDLRIEDSRPVRHPTLSVQAGPPEWEATTMTYEIVDRPEGGVVLNFDHNDFATTDGARAWTIGWATKMLALKKYAETGQRDPFFA